MPILHQLSARELVHALGGRGNSAKCPAHRDSTPSLSVTERNGKILVHCHAGCPQEAVIEALRELRLWPERDELEYGRRIVAEYNYTDEHGTLLYQAVRTDPKGFFQRKADAYGNWLNRGPSDEEKTLYRLPEIIEACIVFLVEGERDVETLRDYGFIATTNVGGAKAAWLPQYTQALRGREVILIPDNDEPGWDRAHSIAAALVEQAEPLIVLDLPSAVKDITDWLLAGHSELELIAMVEAAHAGA